MEEVEMGNLNLQHHLKEQHPNLHSGNLKCMIFGGLDGIITTFAIISSCFGASFGVKTIIILGISNVIADALSMGLGEYISSDLERDYVVSELKKEDYEFDNNLEEEKDELIQILRENENLSVEDSTSIVNTLSNYKQLFLEVMLNKELNLQMPESKKNIIKGSLITFFSFLVFGLIPLLPYFVLMGTQGDGLVPRHIFIISYVCSALAVIILGLIYIRRTKQRWIYVFKIFVIATIAAIMAYFTGWGLESAI
ncbi:VIT family [seawater metagenome]|uniref:VIT family n=1 Tax=seawater metagenome TaxID=1561972 RepID=A0A5E8CME5_9ZZZZ